jgi:CDP-paratose 2-epimerase
MKHSSDRFRSVLILGGAGFIGANWSHRLLEHTEAKVHVFDNLSRPGVRHNLWSLQRAAHGTERLRVTVGDVRDAAAVEKAARDASEIYNFAAQVAVTTSVENPRLDFEVNALGVFNVLEAARKSGRRPFVLFTSTNKVYGDMGDCAVRIQARRYEYQGIKGISESQPLDFHSPYGCSKGAADQYVRDYARIYNLPTVVLRMSCIAGPRQFGNEDQGWVAHFLYSALTQTPLLIYGDGRQVRDVLCVHDLLRVFEAVRDRQSVTAGEIYNVGGGPANSVSLLELMEVIRGLTGAEVRYEFRPRRPGDQLIYITDTTKLQHDTGWKVRYSVPQTLREIQRWWYAHRAALEPAARVGAGLAVPSLERAPGVAA